jgi:hypothetical protein
VSEFEGSSLIQLRRYEARPDAQLAAWELRSKGVAAELRYVGRPDRLDERGHSVLLVPHAQLDRAREILSTPRFAISDEERSAASEGDLHWAPATPYEIESGLAEIRRRDRSARFWMWTVLPVLVLGALSGEQLVFSALGLFWFAALALSQWRAGSVTCPRCGLPFAGASISDHWRAALTRCCVTCGLSKDRPYAEVAG